MKLLTISCSNVKAMQENSASVKTCSIFGQLVAKKDNSVIMETVLLSNLEFTPCIMCGKCAGTEKCVYDENFNQLWQKLKAADLIFFAIPHYAPIPAKLMMVLEKLQEFCFVGYCFNPEYHYPLIGKKAALAAHGGSPEKYIGVYHQNILTPVANALAGAGLKITKVDEDKGIVFGVEEILEKNDALPEMVHNWTKIELLLEKLADEALKMK